MEGWKFAAACKEVAMKINEQSTILTKDTLIELEQKEKSFAGRLLDLLIILAPLMCCAAALLEYLLLPNKRENAYLYRYIILLSIPALVYMACLLMSLVRYHRGDKQLYWKMLYKAPLYSAIYLFLMMLDWLTLKTGKLMYPFIPWVNDIINAVFADWPTLFKSSLYSLRLLLVGYFCGVVTGLLTGIVCGYNKKIRYWVEPIMKVLGPIPPVTWLPLIMLLSKTPFGGSVFIIALGTWFSVTAASMTGISNVDRAYFEAARILGANRRQLIFRVAIPAAMPSILQGMTQGMSSACISLMVAEMMGVEAGLGWYINWVKGWAMYNRMFAAIVVLCIIFNAVTRALDAFKKRALRWQTGGHE